MERDPRPPPEPDELLLDSRKERIARVVSLRTRSLVVVLDRLEDPFNMAAVLRTSEGLGLQEVHVIEHPDYRFRPNDKVTQGCDKWLDLVRHEDFAACRASLKQRGFSLWASAVGEGATPLPALRFDRKVALVFGNERYGVSDEVKASADGLFWIPMRGFTRSFNVSAAVIATLSRAVAWREEHLGEPGDLTEAEKAELTERFFYLSVKQRDRIYKAEKP